MKNELVQLTSNNLMEAIAKLPEELFAMDVDKLRKEIDPTKKLKELKLSMQNEIERAKLEGRNVIVARACHGVITEAYFRREILNRPEVLAWLLIPEVNSDLKLKRMYNDSLEEIDQIMSDILEEIKSEEDSRRRLALRDQYYKFFQSLANRAAPIIQRQEIKTQTIPFNVPDQNRSIEERIAELEERNRQ